MPLRDHFHPPRSEQHHGEGFHSAWANTVVRHLNGSLLPPNFRAVPQVHLGAWVEADVATFEYEAAGAGRGEAAPGEAAAGTALWAPPAPVRTIPVALRAPDVCEVRVYDEKRGARLVGVVEFVSPGNKDRAEHRAAFLAKCAAYLRERVGLVLVDVVTDRRGNFHAGLLELLAPDAPPDPPADLYAAAYRMSRQDGQWRLDTWPASLAVGQPLPRLALWLAGELPIPIDLEETYEETSRVLRLT